MLHNLLGSHRFIPDYMPPLSNSPYPPKGGKGGGLRVDGGWFLLSLLDQDLTDGGALLVGDVLAIDGLVLHLHIVVHLEGGLLQQ